MEWVSYVWRIQHPTPSCPQLGCRALTFAKVTHNFSSRRKLAAHPQPRDVC